MTLSIVDFLRDRIQEDEAAAKAVNAPYRLYVYDDGQVREPEIEDRYDSDDYGSYRRDFDGDEIVPNRHQGYALLYDPARVLREVAAKRAIIEALADVVENGGDGEYRLEQVFKMLATVYRDHPDWREEWRPTS